MAVRRFPTPFRELATMHALLARACQVAVGRGLVRGASALLVVVAVHAGQGGRSADATDGRLSVSWKDNFLTIRGPGAPRDGLVINYLEAYCRPGSTDRPWQETVIGHQTRLIHASADEDSLVLQCQLEDGVTVHHEIRAVGDAVTFQLEAHNPTGRTSLAHWAQPCIRVANFTGRDQESYLDKCFVFLDGTLTRLPTQPWATHARYTPGQVYCPKGVDRNDVNPRPLSALVPTHGLVGCFSADERYVMAVAWEPYQELFQGVIVCVHSDFRIGGLSPGETKKIRGKLYLTRADIPALLVRFERDFPEQFRR